LLYLISINAILLTKGKVLKGLGKGGVLVLYIAKGLKGASLLVLGLRITAI
jgi:hypothetical protein